MTNLFAIGDIHGCREELETLLNKMDIQEKDTVVFMGDYVDRGPDCKGTVEFILDFKEKYKNTVLLRGNHELMWRDALRTPNHSTVGLIQINGGPKYFQQYNLDYFDMLGPENKKLDGLKSSFFKLFNQTEWYFEKDNHIFVHGYTYSYKQHPEKCSPKSLLCWNREYKHYHGLEDKVVVFGHTPFYKETEPKTIRHKKDKITAIGIDLGCVYGNRLCGLNLANGEWWTVKKGE